MASRYSAPAACRGHVTPVRQANGAKQALQRVRNRWLPPPASVSTFRPEGLHSARSKSSPAKSHQLPWQAPSRPNSSSRKNPKNTLIRSDTSVPGHYRRPRRSGGRDQENPKRSPSNAASFLRGFEASFKCINKRLCRKLETYDRLAGLRAFCQELILPDFDQLLLAR